MAKQKKETTRRINVLGREVTVPITCRAKNPPIKTEEKNKQTIAICNCQCFLSCQFRNGVIL